MKRQVLFLIISLLIFLSLVSCVTVNAYTEDTTATDLVEMKIGLKTNGKTPCSWNGYSLTLKPNKKQSKSKGVLLLGFGDVSSVSVKEGVFKQNDKDLFDVTVVKATQENRKSIVVDIVKSVVTYEMQIGDYEPFIISEVKDYANEYYINTRFVKDDLSVKIKAITEYKDSNLRIIR